MLEVLNILFLFNSQIVQKNIKFVVGVGTETKKC